ncbi:hypothetical protein [Paraburkholderia youngii]|uniref:hypothetical protein n=1 Tax=Paraburkholderia youngii TaxID=2782701 RepID=UPI003D1F951C
MHPRGCLASAVDDRPFFKSRESHRQAIGNRQSAIGNRQSAIGNRQSAIGNRQSAIGSLISVSQGSSSWTAM